MEVTALQQEIEDWDWYGIDVDGAIARFSTGGRGRMPQSVSASEEDLRKISEFFENRLDITGAATVGTLIDSYARFRNADERSRYMADFCDMSRRGVYCYDAVMNARSRPSGYFLMSKPTIALSVAALPTEIQAILERTQLKGLQFSTSEIIDVDDLA
ncbi:MAG: hypothetical protein JNM56_30220 [Planctomycetia bacterium]|nr:hypothetical protein [Planctomycetia bacterium]